MIHKPVVTRQLDVGDRLAQRGHRRVDRGRREALAPVLAARVHVQRLRAGVDRRAGVAGELLRAERQRVVLAGRARAVERGLEEHQPSPPAAYSTIDLSISHSTGALSSV